MGLALLAVVRSGRAAEPVHVICDELTAEEAAEIDARTRASLLSEPGSSAEVRIRCELGTATVLAIAGDRSASAVITLPHAGLADALFEAVEGTLEELEPRADAPTVAPAPTALPSAPRPELCTPCVRARERPPDTARARTDAVTNPSITLGVAALGELWNGRFAYGGRVLVAAGGPLWSAGAAVGGLTSATYPAAFRPAEWHALVFASFEPRALGGVRGRVGAGLSVLVVSPERGVVASSGTSLSKPFGELDLERPFRAGRFAVVPALGLRLAARRNVIVDGVSRLELPVVVPQAFVGVSYAL